VSDASVVKALAHPIRVAALALLEAETLSPKEVADRLDVSLPLASYHVRQLAHFGLIELVRTTPRRGTVQHYYRATVHPSMTDLAWGGVPLSVKRKMITAALTQANAAMAAAAAEGGFDRADVHASSIALALDERGWRQLATVMRKTAERVERIHEDAARRLASMDREAEACRATVLLMLFEGPYGPVGGREPGGSQRRGGDGARKS
jgi:DNA-binding transcriptional ArsR family regulator